MFGALLLGMYALAVIVVHSRTESHLDSVVDW